MTPETRKLLSSQISTLRKQGHKQAMLSYVIRDGISLDDNTKKLVFHDRHLASVISTTTHSLQKWCNDHSDTCDEEIRTIAIPACASPKLIKKEEKAC